MNINATHNVFDIQHSIYLPLILHHWKSYFQYSTFEFQHSTLNFVCIQPLTFQKSKPTTFHFNVQYSMFIIHFPTSIFQIDSLRHSISVFNISNLYDLISKIRFSISISRFKIFKIIFQYATCLNLDFVN